MKRVAYFYTNWSSFVAKDVKILSQQYDVDLFQFDVSNKKRIIKQILKQVIFILARRSKKYIYVTQFGGFHSVLPALLGKIFRIKSIVVLGGTDCVSFPSIDYGNFNRLLLGTATRISFKYSSLLLPVDESLIYTTYSYQNDDFPHQGYRAFIKKISTPAVVIPNGYDVSLFNFSTTEPREPNSFITIGSDLSTRFAQKLKGIDLILSLALELSDSKFYIVGGNRLALDDVPKNVILLPTYDNEKLPSILKTKQYYLQLSMSEGFPNALCEAMLCGCIPIVSNVGAMPKIVQFNKKLILEKKNIHLLIELLETLQKNSDTSISAEMMRKKISDHYALSQRSNTLLQVIKNQILHKQRTSAREAF